MYRNVSSRVQKVARDGADLYMLTRGGVKGGSGACGEGRPPPPPIGSDVFSISRHFQSSIKGM